jgi:putative ABC transport system permease protein
MSPSQVIAAVSLAVRSIGRNALRASLTVLGILIGVAAVVTVTALGQGARDEVSSQIAAMGSNAVLVMPQYVVRSGARKGGGSGMRLTEEDGRAIIREIDSAVAASPMLRTKVQAIAGEKNVATMALGSNADFTRVRSWPVRRGAMWSPSEDASKAKVCLLGSTVATKLFAAADPTGRAVRLGTYEYRVLGVLQSKGESPFGGDQDDMILIPSSTVRARMMRTPPDFAGALAVSIRDEGEVDRAVARITSLLRQRHRIVEGEQEDFTIRSQKELQAMQGAVYGVLTILLVCLAAISLVVGGIGVMNIMLVSVTERTREIGIRMAIGARAADVRLQFLVEAVALAMVGGLGGALVGVVAIEAGTHLFDYPMRLSPAALALALGASGLTGIVFGFVPARRASQLDPIDALRHE